MITSYLPAVSAFRAMETLGFRPTAYDRLWHSIFRSDEWLETDAVQRADIVLIGTDLHDLARPEKTLKRPHIALVVFDQSGDVQNDHDKFVRSIRGTFDGHAMSHLELLDVTVGRFDVPEVYRNDFGFLFEKQRNGLKTMYCYYGDPRKEISLVSPGNVRGIDGAITDITRLRPIFLLSLDIATHRPPTHCEELEAPQNGYPPRQFIFRNFRGCSFDEGTPPLVEVITKGQFCNGRHVYDAFRFKHAKYADCDRQHTDWNAIARAEEQLMASIARDAE